MGLNKKISDTNMMIGPVRFSFAHLFKKVITEDNPEGKYTVQILIPKTNTEAVKMIQDACEAAKQAGVSKKFGGKMPPTSKLHMPLRDGDDEYPDDDTYAGMWFMNTTYYGSGKPGVRVIERNEITGKLEPSALKEDGFTPIDEDDFYSGCWGAVTLGFFAYNTKGNMGVAVGVNNVLKTKDDDRLGGGRSADADFSDIGEDWLD